MTFREESAFPGWSDWQRMRNTFTADEVRRADAYLAAGTPDTVRLAEIEARLDGASDDTKWLAEQLRKTWSQIDKLRDRIDDAGTLMDRDYAARAIGYVPWSRETTSG